MRFLFIQICILSDGAFIPPHTANYDHHKSCDQGDDLTFECDDLAGWVHDGAVGWDGPSDGVGGVRHVYDDNLSGVAHLLADTDVLVRLHGEGAEPDVGRVDANIL